VISIFIFLFAAKKPAALGAGEQKVVDRNRGFKTATDGRLIICDSDNEEERVKPGTKRKRQGEDSGKLE
jgi:hypothetical protein